MKFALINIPDHGISGKGYSAPLGLAYIGAVVKSLGYEVKAYDLGANKRLLMNYYLQADKLFLNSLADYKPDFIGMSCSTTNRLNLNFWAGLFKNLLPNVKIIVGGPHPYFIPEIFLKTAVDVDILAMGEGELTIADYLRAVSAGDELDTVKGIAFRNKTGDVIVTPPREVISNLDEIPFPARDLFPIDEYDIDFGTIVGKTATMITSRGCGNLCKFCSTTRYWRKVRFRSAKNIVDEIQNVMENFPFIKNFVFFDDTFTGRRDHAISVCNEILKRKIKINWGCWSRTDNIDEDFLKVLREAGCTTLSFGIESGNDEMLKVIQKKTTVANNYRALTLPGKFGILARGTMIAGMPEERFKWAIDSLLFMIRPGIAYKNLQVSLKTFIFPGTVWEKWFKEKYKDFSWENIPPRFQRWSFTDPFGNVSLPCYRWDGIQYAALLSLRKLMKNRFFRKILSVRLVQATLKKVASLVPDPR